MKKGNILFIDNDKPFLDTRAIFLERAGYEVFKSYTLEEAEKILAAHWIQLIIIDVRATDDNDIHDKSGIEFAHRKAYARIPKIVLTAKPDGRDTRNVLRPLADLNGKSIALDYLDKEQGPNEMVAAVDQVFQNHIELNQQLQIFWKDINCIELLGKIDSNLQPSEVGERLIELDGLLRTLLRKFEEVTISQIFAGLKNRPCLLAYTVNEARQVTKFFVEVGKAADIDKTLVRYENSLAHTSYAAGSHMTEKTLHETTPRYGAIGWTFRGFGTNQYLASFETMMVNNSVSQLDTAMTNLFEGTLKLWQGTASGKEALNIADYFLSGVDSDLTEEHFTNVIRTIEIQSGKVGMNCLQVGTEGEIAFDFPANASSPIIFPNLDQTIKQWSESVRPIELVKGVIHGNLHLNSIFFNQAMLAWLTSFNQCESDSFILIDLLKLAHNLRFKWSKRILPADWMMIEYAALGANPQELLENGSWEKMVVILEAIESQADAQDNLEEGDFSAGLLGMNLSQLSRIDQAAMQGCDEIQGAINLLLSTLLLARKLTHKNSAADLTFAIEHDNQMVIIDENRIELTTQEYKLLCFLEENVNKTVSRAEIANAVFDDVNYDPNDSIEDRGTIDYNRVTMTMSRLREKIDPAGSDYKFISTVRGKGYRLNLEDEAA